MTSDDYPICTCGRTTSGGASGCPLHDTLRIVPLGDTIGTSQLYVTPNNALPEHLQTQAEKDDARIADLETKLAAAEERVRELECCGNCGHYSRIAMTATYRCNEDRRMPGQPHSMMPWSDCRFIPNKWTMRERADHD